MSGDMDSLIDTNVLVAILHARHKHSEKALGWLDQMGRRSVAICRVVQMGALRLLTKPAMMGEDVLSPSEFWLGWDTLQQDDRFVFVSEPKSFEPLWRDLTRSIPTGECAETDAYLASLALSLEMNLVTFDRGFSRFQKVDSQILI